MIAPLVLVYVLTLISSAIADYETDVRINKTYVAFMDRFETFLTQTGDQVVSQAFEAQLNSSDSQSANQSPSSDELRQYSDSVIKPLIEQYGPIAYQIIYDAGYNTNGDYYIFDNSTNQWHLPNQTAPASPVDGASLNAKHLSQELEKAFSLLLSQDQSTTGSNGSSGLRRRWIFRGVSSETQSFVRNLHSLPAEEAFQHAINYKGAGTRTKVGDHAYVKDFRNAVDQQLKLRRSGSTETNNFVRDIETIPNFHERKGALSKKLKELEQNQASESDQQILRAEITRLDEIIMAENRALFKSKIKNTLASFFM